MTNNQRVLVVLGMDRSGTSLCTNVLSALGMSLGTDLLPADRFNQRGYFEDREIWRLHERILAVMARSWDTLSTVRPFPPLWWKSPPMESFRQQLADIVRARIAAAGNGAWGFKDPRTVLLLPLWKAVFQDVGLQPTFFVCVRHPAAVAQSLAARDHFPPLFSELLWLEKTLTACLESWDAPNCLIHYEDWFVQPWRSTETLIDVAGLAPALNAHELKAAVASIVSREMRHDTGGSLQIHSRAAADLYGYLLDYARVPEKKILRGFETALAVAREFACGVEETYAIQQRLLAERDAQIKQYSEALAHAQALVEERDTELRRHAAALAHAETLVFEQNAELKRYIEALAEAQRLVTEQNAQLRQYDAALDNAQHVVAELRQAGVLREQT